MLFLKRILHLIILQSKIYEILYDVSVMETHANSNDFLYANVRIKSQVKTLQVNLLLCMLYKYNFFM